MSAASERRSPGTGKTCKRIPQVRCLVEKLGDRPCGKEIDQERYQNLLQRYIDSVHEVLNVEHMEGPSSTDCNIPLSMGIPAICLGVVRGGKVHTREEWVEVASLSEGCKLLLNFLCR